MGHKEWEPDDFLNEFLDFDYRKPVPDSHGSSSKGVPAEKATQKKQEEKKYGLNDDYSVYEELRHGSNRNAGAHTSAPADAESLRSSDALRTGIQEPLSAHRDIAEPLSAKRDIPEPLSANRDIYEPLSAKRDIPEPLSAQHVAKPAARTEAPAGASHHEPARDSGAGAKGSIADAAGKSGAGAKEPDADARPKRKLRFGGGRASELASGALGAARRFVASEEDQVPEEIPSAAAGVSDIEGLGSIGSVHDPYVAAEFSKPEPAAKPAPAEERDELAELFAELGETDNSSVLSADENEALAQAQNEAYDRYRGNYLKGIRKKMNSGKVGLFQIWLSRIYLISLAAFAVLMTVMNVLPFGMLIAFYVILGLLSIILVSQLRRVNVRRWTRVMASIATVALIALFGLGSAYAMGTLSFLDTTSVDNENRVASVTRDAFNVCITGMDVDGKIDEEGRSDVNMIVTVNPKTEHILLTSIPRDYQIYMPDKDNAMDKLTHTGFYGVHTTIGAEEQLLETKINYYVKVNFTTVKKFIDAVGGIDVYSEYEFNPVKMKKWTVQKGWNHMNGRQALAFARERKAFPDGDNQRIKNQQAVFEAVIKKAMSSKTMALSYNKILSNLGPYFKMSFSSGELRSLIKLQLAKDPKWKIFRNTIIGGDGSLPTYSTGSAYAYVMTQDEASIGNAKTLINAVLEGRTLAKDDDNNVYVADEGGDDASSGDNGDPEGE